jgi:hypothetical protein
MEHQDPRSTLSASSLPITFARPRRTKTTVKRMQRERKSAEGMMLQIDASPLIGRKGRAIEDGIYWTRLMTPLARSSMLGFDPVKIILLIGGNC